MRLWALYVRPSESARAVAGPRLFAEISRKRMPSFSPTMWPTATPPASWRPQWERSSRVSERLAGIQCSSPLTTSGPASRFHERSRSLRVAFSLRRSSSRPAPLFSKPHPLTSSHCSFLSNMRASAMYPAPLSPILFPRSTSSAIPRVPFPRPCLDTTRASSAMPFAVMRLSEMSTAVTLPASSSASTRVFATSSLTAPPEKSTTWIAGFDMRKAPSNAA
mmetsp:Transcript_60251/g.191417  ORF Transcript_60251/g.191417 Transcript_60251/m.191417 type:complete len:220 (-) Transcript_60251:1082-1741(-)